MKKIIKTLLSHRGMNTFLCFEWMISHSAVLRQPQNVSLFAINSPPPNFLADYTKSVLP
jgi:hypothetical protein